MHCFHIDKLYFTYVFYRDEFEDPDDSFINDEPFDNQFIPFVSDESSEWYVSNSEEEEEEESECSVTFTDDGEGGSGDEEIEYVTFVLFSKCNDLLFVLDHQKIR